MPNIRKYPAKCKCCNPEVLLINSIAAGNHKRLIAQKMITTSTKRKKIEEYDALKCPFDKHFLDSMLNASKRDIEMKTRVRLDISYEDGVGAMISKNHDLKSQVFNYAKETLGSIESKNRDDHVSCNDLFVMLV